MNQPEKLRQVGGSVRPIPINDLAQKTAENYSVHIRKILEEESTTVEFLVPGCIPRGNIILLTGESGAKKSWLAYDLARAVSSGTGWLGKNMPCADGPLSTMILNYDNPTETLRTRLKKLGFSPEDDVYIHTLGHTTPTIANGAELLTLPAEATRLKYVLEHRKPALVIFDSFRQGVTLDENDSQKMAELMNIFKTWTKINNTTVVLIHHTTKNEKSGGWKAEGRGSGEIVASSDVVLKATLVSQSQGTVEWTKSRTWNVGNTTKTDFEVVDQYKDAALPEDDLEGMDSDELKEINLIERVLVRAKSPLPFELELKAIEIVLAELRKSNLPFLNFKTLKNRLVKPGTDIKDEGSLHSALKSARKLGKAKFVQGRAGRGYTAVEA